MNKSQLQQGDVCIEKVAKLPAGAKRLNHLVLAKGEVTGHAHKVREVKGASLFQFKDDLFLDVTAPSVTLVHEEHKTITIPKGIHKISILKEYDYDTKEVVKVQD